MNEYKKKIMYMIVIYFIAYIYCFNFAFNGNIVKDDMSNISIFDKIRLLNDTCVIQCNNDICKNLIKNRGNNYFISSPEVKQVYLKNCFVTFWGATHFMLYFVIGFLLPSMFFESFIIGIMFEYYEYVKFECEDPMDIVLNSSGFLVGKYVREKLYDNNLS